MNFIDEIIRTNRMKNLAMAKPHQLKPQSIMYQRILKELLFGLDTVHVTYSTPTGTRQTNAPKELHNQKLGEPILTTTATIYRKGIPIYTAVGYGHSKRQAQESAAKIITTQLLHFALNDLPPLKPIDTSQPGFGTL